MFTLKKLTSLVVLALSCSSLAADVPPPSEFEKWQKQRAQQFSQFVSKQDQDFSQFLQQRWLVKQVEVAPKRDVKPKLKRAPTAPKKQAEADTSKPVKVIKPRPTKPLMTPPKDIAKPSREVGPVAPKLPLLMANKVTFLGNKLSISDISLARLDVSLLDEQAIADSWQTMATNKKDSLVEQLVHYGNKLNLDDWGKAYLTYEVIKQSANKLTPNEVTLYTWYYLLQQGFDVRIGYQAEQVHLLLKVTQPLYAQKFFSFGQDKYYFVNFSAEPTELNGKIKTYQNQHGLARADLSIDLAKIPMLAGEKLTRTLEFNYRGKRHSFAVPYNKAYVAFLNLYPQLELEHYFQAGLELDSKQALLNYLAPAIEGKTEKQALNLLLRFVQYAFAYKTDDQQFNQENFLVATETLHYPYADCEDRSVLLAYLVRHLLGNKMIGVLYQGHIAIAIKTNNDIDGAGYRVNGDKYLVADPTYIGASLGQVMPGYDKQSPKLVPIN